jgi:hypothetical protein
MRSSPLNLAMLWVVLAAPTVGGAPARDGAPTAAPAPTAPLGVAGTSDQTAEAAANDPAPDVDRSPWSYETSATAAPPLDFRPGAAATSRPQDLSSSPMAPLPPGLLIAPIGLAIAAWMTYRIKRRRGII